MSWKLRGYNENDEVVTEENVLDNQVPWIFDFSADWPCDQVTVERLGFTYDPDLKYFLEHEV